MGKDSGSRTPHTMYGNTSADDSVTPDAELHAVTVERDGEPDECTLYPRGASGFERMSAWITATERTFVDLRTVR
ncbi:DUF7511 domain-containing protein [Halostella pelagica]|uniref:DUF7511 domain-containing protein n=1 Tax=Halostella pelagica TaxID=2583824 RepID=UPI00192A51F1|nr:hypothetical protein [Halostella pelagica]